MPISYKYLNVDLGTLNVRHVAEQHERQMFNQDEYKKQFLFISTSTNTSFPFLYRKIKIGKKNKKKPVIKCYMIIEHEGSIIYPVPILAVYLCFKRQCDSSDSWIERNRSTQTAKARRKPSTLLATRGHMYVS